MRPCLHLVWAWVCAPRLSADLQGGLHAVQQLPLERPVLLRGWRSSCGRDEGEAFAGRRGGARQQEARKSDRGSPVRRRQGGDGPRQEGGGEAQQARRCQGDHKTPMNEFSPKTISTGKRGCKGICSPP